MYSIKIEFTLPGRMRITCIECLRENDASGFLEAVAEQMVASNVLQSRLKIASTKNPDVRQLLVDEQAEDRDKRKSPEQQFSNFMENCAMSERSKLGIRFLGIKIDAEGVFAIRAALLIVLAVLAASRF